MLVLEDRVRFVETDMMGVVHHANYFRWFEMGRVAYLREAGINLPDLMADGYLFPITDARCTYRASAHFDEIILIKTDLVEVSRVKMVFAYQIRRKQDNLLLAEGVIQNVFTSRESNQVSRLPNHYFERLRDYAVRNRQEGVLS